MLRVVVVLLAAVLMIVVGIGGYGQAWTGFASVAESADGFSEPKRLWDWLELLIIPAALALAATFIEGSRRRSDAAAENERQRQEVLDGCFEFFTPLLLEGKLGGATAQREAGAQVAARARVLSAVRQLDGRRKSALLQFVCEAGLLGPAPLLQLNGADFSDADLTGAVLSHCELRGVHFQRAVFKNAQLVGADLRGSDFTDASFVDARMMDAKLDGARIRGAKLRGANCRGVSTVQTDPPTSFTETVP